MSFFAWLNTFNLLDVFNCYLIIAFIASTAVNVGRYRAILGVLYGFPGRWPKLLELVNRHRTVFFGWPTLLAIGLAFILMLSNSLAIRLIWTQAKVTFDQLWGLWLPLAAVLLAGGFMLFLDIKALIHRWPLRPSCPGGQSGQGRILDDLVGGARRCAGDVRLYQSAQNGRRRGTTRPRGSELGRDRRYVASVHAGGNAIYRRPLPLAHLVFRLA